eukprot:COSAG02_NODE_65372_length_258_cov_0.647799_1_plen_30_part_10
MAQLYLSLLIKVPFLPTRTIGAAEANASHS